ncbi:MAG: D-2-hydroxyacid dehydrogenase [Chloroflexota bacterium]|nr:D-2-hydroxyacid dehydrogenase [Dehalococcoidia bacterium]MDW8253293.1 D-2-hydroxyacid dehydrogenase [Chloroflexota bacterium]
MTVVIGVLTALSPAQLDRIRAVGDVEVRDLSHLVASQHGVPRQDEPAARELDAQLAECEVLFATFTPRGIAARAPKVRWFHGSQAGIDAYRASGFLESEAIITLGRGWASRPIAEWVIGAILLLAKRYPKWVNDDARRQWSGGQVEEILGQTVGIFGFGGIGRETARLAHALGMRVLAAKRTPEAPPPYVEALYGPEGLPVLLRESDYLVLAAPATPETENLIGAAELAQMKPTARLINVGRGTILDEEALAAALRERRLAGAALDVYRVEPLPETSPLRSAPNILLSPHRSFLSQRLEERVVTPFLDNLRRYLAGEPLLHRYDPARGY